MRRIFHSIVCLLILFSFSQVSFAETTNNSVKIPFIGVTTSNNVIVYRGADIEYTQTAVLSKDQEVYVIDIFKNQKNELWLRINSNTVTGWVKNEFIKEAQFKLTKMISTGNNVSVRKGAMTSYDKIDSLNLGQQVEAVDRFLNQNYEEWYRIKIGNQFGWVIGTYLAVDTSEESPSKDTPSEDSPSNNTPKTLYANENNTPVKRGALESYATSYVLQRNEKVEIIDEITNSLGELWYRVETQNGIYGWVYSKSLQPDLVPDVLEMNSIVYAKKDLAIRRGALSSYEAVANIKMGEQLTIIDYFVNQQKELWYRVKLNNNILGWVLSAEIQETAIPISDQVLYVNVETANLRSGATTSYKVVSTLTKNTAVKVIDQIINSNNELWYRVQVGDGTLGWILSTLLQNDPFTEKVFYVIENTSVYSGAATSYKKVSSLSKGKEVKVIDQFTHSNLETWYRVDLGNNLYGWVISSALSVEVAPIKKQMVIGTKSAELRRGADFGYQVTQKLPERSTVTVISEFFNVNGQKWMNVELSNGVRGWVPAWELYDSLNDRKYYYSSQNNVLRRGASTSYKENATVKSGDPLLYLNRNNDWINVENSNGIRGWILLNQVVEVVPNLLSGPSISQLSAAETLITWTKSKNIPITYSIQSDKSLKVNAANTLIDLPKGKIVGLSSIQTFKDYFVLKPDAGYSFTLRNYDNRFTLKISRVGIANKRILIDAGHGAHDAGASGPTKLKEKDVNLAVAKYLQSELQKLGAVVVLTRSTDVFLTLDERVQLSNGSNYDAFVSVHANSNYNTAARGTETYYNINSNFNGVKSMILATEVQKTLVNKLGTYDRGIKTADFYVIKNNEVPSILVELAFLSNPAEETLLRSETARKNAALGIAQGLKNYFDGGN
ncbi:SH3 domain-containing protein [Lederbergia citri]|uniref:SH3 domain-containing protein n=1 Tax=Lederbergia citri TaxID=2833580 RepID=A0A942TGG6_9BACI|nr:SH3 domain-containing protein [Lederbergia citri]MBS4195727.1 SH3 domain-containing protein [Lederbergia citri]